MLSGTLDDQYFAWLCNQVGIVGTRRSSKTYWRLIKHLYSTEFAWVVPNDDNRAEDGRELRCEWCNENDIDRDDEWFTLGCSFLELLIGLSRRLSFEAEGTVDEWFWHMLANMELLEFNDRRRFAAEDIDDRTHMVIWRTYDRNGVGGLFPLRDATRDQRHVELWYQLSEYLLQDQ